MNASMKHLRATEITLKYRLAKVKDDREAIDIHKCLVHFSLKLGKLDQAWYHLAQLNAGFPSDLLETDQMPWAGQEFAGRTLAIPDVVPLSDYSTDFYDTACAIMALDMVVTTDTSVAHLAGE